jgi:hypothetical protein
MLQLWKVTVKVMTPTGSVLTEGSREYIMMNMRCNEHSTHNKQNYTVTLSVRADAAHVVPDQAVMDVPSFPCGGLTPYSPVALRPSKTNSVTFRPQANYINQDQLVGVVTWSAQGIPTAVYLGFLELNCYFSFK